MAKFHIATNNPSKVDLVGEWLPKQSWAHDGVEAPELIASFHLDDPAGEVGMQVFAVRCGEHLYQVPLTYRSESLADSDEGLIGLMEHSTLGARYVYDGLADSCFVSVLAGVAAIGYGQALGFANHDGQFLAIPDEMLLRGSGMIGPKVRVDGFRRTPGGVESETFRNGVIELTFYRRLRERPQRSGTLSATWAGQEGFVPLVDIERIDG